MKTPSYFFPALLAGTLGLVTGLTGAGITEVEAVSHTIPLAKTQIAPVPAGPRNTVETWLNANLCPALDARWGAGACSIPSSFVNNGGICFQWYVDGNSLEQMKVAARGKLHGSFIAGAP